MKCPICKNELVIKSKKVGENPNGEVIYNEFAICHDCKKQWNLDKQRAKEEAKKAPVEVKTETPAVEPAAAAPAQAPRKKKRPAPETEIVSEAQPRPKKKKRPVNPEAAAKTEVSKKSEDAPVSDRPRKKKRPANPDAVKAAETKVVPSTSERPQPKKKRPVDPEQSERPARPKKVKPAPKAMDEPIKEFSDALDEAYEARPKTRKRKPADTAKEEPALSNIPPKHVRESREREMRENYQYMLDEGADEEESRFPVALIIILILILLAAAAFAGYWFFLR